MSGSITFRNHKTKSDGINYWTFCGTITKRKCFQNVNFIVWLIGLEWKHIRKMQKMFTHDYKFYNYSTNSTSEQKRWVIKTFSGEALQRGRGQREQAECSSSSVMRHHCLVPCLNIGIRKKVWTVEFLMRGAGLKTVTQRWLERYSFHTLDLALALAPFKDSSHSNTV